MLLIGKARYLLAFGLVLFCTLIFTPALVAEVPDRINYQGLLTDTVGNPVPDGTYAMHFELHTTESGETDVWSQTMPAVSIVDGVYNVELGPFIYPEQVFDGDLYLEVEVNGEVLSPRQRLASTAFAMRAQVADDADTLDGMDSTEFDQSAHVASTSNPHNVSAAQIGAVTLPDITWGNLSGIPGGFSDGVDDTGITIETDPTITDISIKDGVSWGELSGIPSGFADGVDNNSGGDITGVTAGTGLSGGGAYGYVTLNVDIPFDITGSVNAGGLISAENSHSNGYGVFGESPHRGVYGRGYTDIGTGVFGESTGYDGVGVQGRCNGDSGIGVYGEASGEWGRAFEGRANGTTGTNHGGYFFAAGSTGRGVMGEASGENGTGVYGYASGTAVYGGEFRAVDDNSDNYIVVGVKAVAEGYHSVGVDSSGNLYDYYARGPGIDYGTHSSIRWKQNIQEIDSALEMVLQIRGVYFDWDEEHGGRHDIGFIAEEVGEHVPEIVAYEQDSEYANGLDYGKMTPILLQAIKEQQGIISELRVEMETLRAEIKAIKAGNK